MTLEGNRMGRTFPKKVNRTVTVHLFSHWSCETSADYSETTCSLLIG